MEAKAAGGCRRGSILVSPPDTAGMSDRRQATPSAVQAAEQLVGPIRARYCALLLRIATAHCHKQPTWVAVAKEARAVAGCRQGPSKHTYCLPSNAKRNTDVPAAHTQCRFSRLSLCITICNLSAKVQVALLPYRTCFWAGVALLAYLGGGGEGGDGGEGGGGLQRSTQVVVSATAYP